MTESEFNRTFAEKVGCSVEEFKARANFQEIENWITEGRSLMWRVEGWLLEDSVDPWGFRVITLYKQHGGGRGVFQIAYYCEEEEADGLDEERL